MTPLPLVSEAQARLSQIANEIDEAEGVVRVVDIDHRRDAYRT
jgi:hypothetical protein